MPNFVLKHLKLVIQKKKGRKLRGLKKGCLNMVEAGKISTRETKRSLASNTKAEKNTVTY